MPRASTPNRERRAASPSTAWLCVSALGLLSALAGACGDPSEGANAREQGVPNTEQRPEASHHVEAEFRFEGAERIVVGTVKQVTARLDQNEWGDTLILSTVRVDVREQLRGDGPDSVEFELEGGTLGETTLNVSDMPRLSVGDQGVFALRRHRTRARWVPNLRGNGVRIGDVNAHREAILSAERTSR